MRNILVLIIFSFLNCSAFSQILLGTIFDASTKQPLEDVSVYLDGTTIGTTTNINGAFSLELNSQLKASLVISYIGYKTKIYQIEDFNKFKKVYLEEQPNQLKEVYILADPWSREKKLQIFKSEFLGKTKASTYCKIENEKDISLSYNPTTNTLIAFSEKPIIIKNKYLGYNILYNLVDFEIQFTTDIHGLRYTSSVYSSGTSFFSQLRKKIKKRISHNREKAYQGSTLHFMRALSSKQLKENNFGIYYKSLPVNPHKYLTITKQSKLTKVEMKVKKLSILYNRLHQSSIELLENNGIFYIDKHGNHSPPHSLGFGGHLGLKRISSMLPLNYNYNYKSN